MRHSSRDWTARFGYENPNATVVARPVGASNYFLPRPADRGQPTSFQPGRQRAVFQVPFRPLQPAAWVLDGRLALGTILSPRCP